MSKILVAIPPQNFEIIRDRLAVILADELENQVLFYNPELDANVYVERTDPINNTELPALNVSLASGSYDNKDVTGTDGTYTFNIDAYTSAKATALANADTQSTFNLHRLLGVCRYILENPVYRNLGYVTPYISRVTVGSINIAEPGAKDALSTFMGRLTVTVRVVETTALLPAELIAGYETAAKLYTTEQGYVLSKSS